MAMVVADGRKHPGALLFVDNSVVPAWQKSHNLPAQSADEFWRNPLVMEELQKLVADVNAKQCSWERVVRWRVIQQVPTIADGGLTPTLKLRRVDPACAELDYVTGEGRELDIEYAMSNNFAFGGVNTSLIFRRV